MNKFYKQIVDEYSNNSDILNSIIVSIFIKTNKIKVSNNTSIKEILITKDSQYWNIIQQSSELLTFEELINIFELAIPKEEVIVNGAVYTPEYIKEYIINESFIKYQAKNNKVISEWICADLSCGCGAFLYTLAKKIKGLTNLTYHHIFSNLYGFDICHNSIKRTEILLTLLALSENEDNDKFSFRLYSGNSLSSMVSDVLKTNNILSFDVIVGNPPYVRSKNIDIQTKELLTNWSVSSGNADLYIPFFELGLKHLSSNGVLGYITVNTFFKSINARLLRRYIQEPKYTMQIVDFGQELIFGKKLAYTCIAFIEKSKSNYLSFTKGSAEQIKCNDLHFEQIPYTQLDPHKGWNLNENKIRNNISAIEQTGIQLGVGYSIKNGLATLANSTYIFTPIKCDTRFYYLEQQGEVFKIERKICRDIIKPNVIKTEFDVASKMEKIIFPYMDGKLICEATFSNEYPHAYTYLKHNIELLNRRDKGQANYEYWYAFGRTQALNDVGKKLLLPYMSNKPYVIYADQSDLLIYCGYAIYSQSKDELMILKKILESCVFDYYIKHTSKPYSTGYYSYAKNYIKHFGVCDLSVEEKNILKEIEDKHEIDKFILTKYNISI